MAHGSDFVQALRLLKDVSEAMGLRPPIITLSTWAEGMALYAALVRGNILISEGPRAITDEPAPIPYKPQPPGPPVMMLMAINGVQILFPRGY